MAGKTSVEIIGTGTGVDETLLPELGWLREFGVISPVIEGSAALVTGDVQARCRGAQMEAVKVLGVDILRDQPFRDYQLLELRRLASDGLAVATGDSQAPPLRTTATSRRSSFSSC